MSVTSLRDPTQHRANLFKSLLIKNSAPLFSLYLKPKPNIALQILFTSPRSKKKKKIATKVKTNTTSAYLFQISIFSASFIQTSLDKKK
jgi:hypothetical protein